MSYNPSVYKSCLHDDCDFSHRDDPLNLWDSICPDCNRPFSLTPFPPMRCANPACEKKFIFAVWSAYCPLCIPKYGQPHVTSTPSSQHALPAIPPHDVGVYTHVRLPSTSRSQSAQYSENVPPLLPIDSEASIPMMASTSSTLPAMHTTHPSHRSASSQMNYHHAQSASGNDKLCSTCRAQPGLLHGFGDGKYCDQCYGERRRNRNLTPSLPVECTLCRATCTELWYGSFSQRVCYHCFQQQK